MGKRRDTQGTRAISVRLKFDDIAGCIDLMHSLHAYHPDDGLSTIIRRALQTMLLAHRKAEHIPTYEDQIAAWEAIKRHKPSEFWIGREILLEGLHLEEAAPDMDLPMTPHKDEALLHEELEKAAARAETGSIEDRIKSLTGDTTIRDIPEAIKQEGKKRASKKPPWEGLPQPNAEEVSNFLLKPKGANSAVAELLTHAKTLDDLDENRYSLELAINAALGQAPKQMWHEEHMRTLIMQFQKRFNMWKELKEEEKRSE